MGKHFIYLIIIIPERNIAIETYFKDGESVEIHPLINNVRDYNYSVLITIYSSFETLPVPNPSNIRDMIW